MSPAQDMLMKWKASLVEREQQRKTLERGEVTMLECLNADIDRLNTFIGLLLEERGMHERAENLQYGLILEDLRKPSP